MEHKIYLLWLNAVQNMLVTSGSKYAYWEGQNVALTEAMAILKDCTFIEANRLLMNMYGEDETNG